MTKAADISIILPILNESETLRRELPRLKQLSQQGCELIFVDGGSRDDSVDQLQAAGMYVVHSESGRAIQMNLGASQAGTEQLVFLHIDTRLPDKAPDLVRTALNATGQGGQWGRFDVCIDGRHPVLKLVGWMMNQRSRLTGIATGDQTLFMQRDLFKRVGGFPQQPLMEDIEMSRRLKQLSRPVCLKDRVYTSGRRWEQSGVWRTIGLMWWLRFAYWRGVSAERLVRLYR